MIQIGATPDKDQAMTLLENAKDKGGKALARRNTLHRRLRQRRRSSLPGTLRWLLQSGQGRERLQDAEEQGLRLLGEPAVASIEVSITGVCLPVVLLGFGFA